MRRRLVAGDHDLCGLGMPTLCISHFHLERSPPSHRRSYPNAYLCWICQIGDSFLCNSHFDLLQILQRLRIHSFDFDPITQLKSYRSFQPSILPSVSFTPLVQPVWRCRRHALHVKSRRKPFTRLSWLAISELSARLVRRSVIQSVFVNIENHPLCP